MNEKCDKCGVVGEDRRTLWMACMYEMGELGVPFAQRAIYGVHLERKGMKPGPWRIPEFEDPPWNMEEAKKDRWPFFTLRVCKGCRGEWMEAIKAWFRAKPGDISRWNNDASDDGPHEMSVLLARLEELRTEHAALEQRILATVAVTREEHDARTRRDR